MARTWVVGFDFSECANAALDEAASELAAVGGNLVLVHAYQEPMKSLAADIMTTSPSFESLSDVTELLRQQIISRLDKVIARLKETYPSLGLTGVTAVGFPERVILDEADRLDADRIVLGTRGNRGLKLFFIGSVTERVLRETKRPVLVVRSQD